MLLSVRRRGGGSRRRSSVHEQASLTAVDDDDFVVECDEFHVALTGSVPGRADDELITRPDGSSIRLADLLAQYTLTTGPLLVAWGSGCPERHPSGSGCRFPVVLPPGDRRAALAEAAIEHDRIHPC